MGSIRPNIVLFGDSITEWSFQVDQTGWGASLANHYKRKTDVLNRGFGGYTTRLAQLLLDKIFPTPSSNPPMLVTVLFGANDAADPNAAHGVLHVPLKEYAENLQKIIAHIKAVELVSGLSMTQLGDYTGVPTRRNDLAKLYADECVKVAKATDVPVINLWSICEEAPEWQEKYLCDGVHLSAAGNAKLFEELLKILDDPHFVPTLKSDQMPWDYPCLFDLGDDPVATVKSWSTPYLK